MFQKLLFSLCFLLATGLISEDFRYDIISEKTLNEDGRVDFKDHLGDVIFIEAFSST